MSNLGFGNISFPVFRVGVKEPQHDSGVSFYLLGTDTTEQDAEYKLLVIDDKNRPEPTLSLRRLALKSQGVDLYSLTKAIFFIGDLIKLAKSNTWFVDREGQFFQYKKSQRVPLVFRQIKSVTRLPSGGGLIEVVGFSQRFKTLFMPEPSQTHAGLLLIQKSVVLYGLYSQPHDDTVRAV